MKNILRQTVNDFNFPANYTLCVWSLQCYLLLFEPIGFYNASSELYILLGCNFTLEVYIDSRFAIMVYNVSKFL